MCQAADPSKYSGPVDQTCVDKPSSPVEKLWCIKPQKYNGVPDPEWVAPNDCCGEKPFNNFKKFCCEGERLSKTPCGK